jgi:hypothetical protein
MEQFKSIKLVLLILFVVLVLVIVRTTGNNHFRQDAQNAVEAVVSNDFSISASELKNTKNQFMIVDLSEVGKSQFDNSLQIPFENLLDESTLQKFKESEYKILLVSTDDSKAEKAWVILNQLDLKNVFVLSNYENPEVLKYKFKPVTGAMLESVSE